MQDKNSIPLLSVVTPVYNHGAFISKALDSVLMQETNFNFDIIITDDCSTDNTREILRYYKEKYPEKIKLLLTEKNQGVNRSSFEAYRNSESKYVAMLEGDDEWIYKHKLQEQVDFLENNPDFVGCFHDAKIVSDKDKNVANINQFHHDFKYYSQFNKYRREFTSAEIIERNIIPTASLVFRNNKNIETFFQLFADIKLSLIWAFQIFIVGKGKLCYFNEVWSIYNDHAEGVSKKQSLNSFKLSNIVVLKRFIVHLEGLHKYSIYHTIALEYLQILYNRQNADMKKSSFYKYLLFYTFYSLKSYRYQISNVSNFRKNIKRNSCAV